MVIGGRENGENALFLKGIVVVKSFHNGKESEERGIMKNRRVLGVFVFLFLGI